MSLASQLTGGVGSRFICTAEARQGNVVADRIGLAIDTEVVVSEGTLLAVSSVLHQTQQPSVTSLEATSEVETRSVCCRIDDLIRSCDHIVRGGEFLVTPAMLAAIVLLVVVVALVDVVALVSVVMLSFTCRLGCSNRSGEQCKAGNNE